MKCFVLNVERKNSHQLKFKNMAHHGSDPFMGNKDFTDFFKKSEMQGNNDFAAEAFKTKKPNGLGATGNFPDGKISESDEGEIKIGVTNMDGRVVIEFGKPIHWVGLTKKQAAGFAELLIKHSK